MGWSVGGGGIRVFQFDRFELQAGCIRAEPIDFHNARGAFI
jgi:hypothetical protein